MKVDVVIAETSPGSIRINSLNSNSVHQEGDSELVMEYRSEKPFADLAECLLIAAIDHFKEKVTVTVEEDRDFPSNHRIFKLKKV